MVKASYPFYFNAKTYGANVNEKATRMELLFQRPLNMNPS